MQKYLYRHVIVLTILTILFSITLDAQVTPKVMVKKFKKELNLVSPKKIEIKNKDFLKNLNESSKKSLLKYGNTVSGADINKFVTTKDDYNTTKNTIFYMYSDSVPFAAIKNLIPQISKFKKHNPNTQFFIVLNGFPTKKFLLRLRKEYKEKYKDIFSIKVHPFIYKYYGLKMVPAYIFCKCDLGDNFRFRKCRRNEAVMAKGDMSLVDFFNILSDKNKKYLKYYNQMIEAE